MKIEKNKKIKFITIIEPVPTKKDGILFNLCRCDCGREVLIRRETLRTERIRDCGCGTYKLKQYLGQRFGRLTVVDAYRKRFDKMNIVCVCRCDCGNLTDIVYSNLKSGNRVSCGCLNKFNFENYKNKVYHGIKILNIVDKQKKKVQCECKCGAKFECKLTDITSKKRHIIGCSSCKEYVAENNAKFIWNVRSLNVRLKNIYNGMKDRCENPLNKDFHLYGDKGISVCEEWKKSYDSFKKWAYENGYEDSLTIDRIDGNKGYCPSNCRWITIKEQQNNRCNNRVFIINGQKYTLSQLSEIYNINYSTLRSRLNKGMQIELAISAPVKKRG